MPDPTTMDHPNQTWAYQGQSVVFFKTFLPLAFEKAIGYSWAYGWNDNIPNGAVATHVVYTNSEPDMATVEATYSL